MAKDKIAKQVFPDNHFQDTLHRYLREGENRDINIM
jgi:hypothetical protein